MQEMLESASKPAQLYEARIADNRQIAQNQWSIWLKTDEGELPDFLPGNFCMLSLLDRVDPVTPRPFAIVEKKEGMYNFIYRQAGKFTSQLLKMPVGSKVGCLGPLGRGVSASGFKRGRHIFIAGGVGYASLLPLLDEHAKQNPSKPKIFYGLRTEIEMIRRGSYETMISTDDGSAGFQGRITGLLDLKKDLIAEGDHFFVCGPTPMMKAVYAYLPPERSYYFLEEAMGCGVGVCMGCVVPVSDKGSGTDGDAKYVRSCLEGSMFRGDRLSRWIGENS